MASLPLKIISDLYFKCVNDKGRTYSGGRAYEMEVSREGHIWMSHYGTTIFLYDPKKKTTTYGGAYSMSDRDAINSLVIVSRKGKGVYYEGGRLYQDGTGPRFKKKTVKKKVVRRR